MTSAYPRKRVGLAVSLAVATAGSTVAMASAATAATATAGVGTARVGTAASGTAVSQHRNGVIAWAYGTGWKTTLPDGTGERTVVPTGAGYTPGQTITDIAYSHDGTRVAFAVLSSVMPPGSNGFDVWVSAADGTGAVKIASLSAGAVSWSGDDKTVYYDKQAGPNSTAPIQIYVAAADGSGSAPLFAQPTGFSDRAPVAYADGSVTFLRNAVGYVLSPGSSTPHALPLPAGAKLVGFSPDGSRIAVVLQTPDVHAEKIALLKADGTLIGDVYDAPNGAYLGGITWSPDGTELAWWQRAAFSADPTLEVAPAVVGSTPSTLAVPDFGFGELTWQPVVPGGKAVLDRIGGADRVATAIDASQWSYNGTGAGGRQASVAVLSRSDDFADALAGNALAAQKHGPLLLTATGALDSRVATELQRILAPHAVVYLLGGDAALSPAVEKAVQKLGFTTERLAGANRYGTAVAIAGTIAPSGPHTVMLATGIAFPDALSAGVAAAQDPNGGVVLLSNGDMLPAETRAYLNHVDPHQTKVYGVGGQGVNALAGAFPSWKGLTTPLAGNDRYATAYAVATSSLFGHGWPVRVAGVATSQTWPDALSGGALIASQHGPLLLTGPTGPSAAEAALLTADHLSGLVVFGGDKAVSASAASVLGDDAFGAGTWTEQDDRQAPPAQY